MMFVSSTECPDQCPLRRGVFALLVAAQFSIVITMIFSLRSPHLELLPQSVQASGVAVGLWAIFSMGYRNLNISPAVRPDAQLVMGGPYRFVRHPMYSALLLFTASYVLSSRSGQSVRLWLGLVVVLGIKTMYEEQLLKKRFPGYANYAASTKRFVPFVF